MVGKKAACLLAFLRLIFHRRSGARSKERVCGEWARRDVGEAREAEAGL